MTIAAGFNCSDAILLCADTQHTTQGVSKLFASKLFSKEYLNGARSAIAIVGNIAYARMLMQHIEMSIEAMDPDHLTVKNLRDAVEFEVAQLHTENIFKHPNHQYGTVTASVLCAVWAAKDNRTALFWSQDAAVNELFGYTCLGTGDYLAHYIIRPTYKSTMSQLEVRPFAIDAIAKVKDYVDGCGGATEVVSLQRNGILGQVERL